MKITPEINRLFNINGIRLELTGINEKIAVNNVFSG